VNGAPLTTPPVLTVVGCDQLPKPALAYLGEQGPASPEAPSEAEPGPPAAVAQDPTRVSDAYSRQVARKRRRDTLMVLVLTFACSLFLGMIPATRMLWVVSVVSAVAIVAYVAVLVHLQGGAEEREGKLHYLRPESQYGVSGHQDDRYQDARYGHPADRSVAAR
jgi:hypothetical protein